MADSPPQEGLELDSAASLRNYFATRLPERLREVEEAWERARASGWQPEETRTFHRLSHSLSGAGATFGFPAVTEAARLLEKCLKPVVQGSAPPPDDATVTELLAGLHRASRLPTDAESDPAAPAEDPAPKPVLPVESDPETGTRGEFRDGVMTIVPLELAATPFGLIFGAAAVEAGLSPGETILMSATVFAGSAQFLAVSLWSHPAPWLWLGFAVLLVNLRHVLMGASVARKMERFQPWQRWLAAFVLADENWAMSERRALSRPLTPAFYAGMGVTMYVWWVVATTVGTIAGSFIPQPELLGLDFAFPAVVICLILGFAKSWHAAPVVAASAVAALLTHRFVEGTWFVVAGGLAGMIAAVLLPAPKKTDDER